jgi:hypothetical protein
VDGKELVSKLVELDDRDFTNIGRVKPHSQNTKMRLLLLEMDVHLMDDAEMGQFRKSYGKATKLRAEEKYRGKARFIESRKRTLEDAIRKVEGHMAILTPGVKNVAVKGTKLLWTCPQCGERQEADLSKSEDDPKFLKVNGKYVSLHRRGTRAPPPRIIPSKGEMLFNEPNAMEISGSSMEGRGAGIVSMPPGRNDAAVIRLAKGTIIQFGFGCSRCNFRNRDIDIGVK